MGGTFPVSKSQADICPSDQTGAPGLLFLVIALFFMWGGITSLNDILIPKLKGLFSLTYTEVMLVQFCFFTAYAVISIPAGNLVARVGYMKGIVLGLVVMATGCLLFIPASQTAIYVIFLAALFVLASGITILQVAANPLISNLGPASTSHSRLTFAQAFNSLGTTIAPYIGAKLILDSFETPDQTVLTIPEMKAFQIENVAIISHTYMAIAIILILITIIFWLTRNRITLNAQKIIENDSLKTSTSLLKNPRFRFGMLAIFLYVGAEVTIGSILANYLMLPTTQGLDAQAAGKLITLYWGGAMLGRFLGAGLLRIISPGKVLTAAAIGAGTLIIISLFSAGNIAGWALISVGLCNSIMFPTIFSLALEKLGARTAQGSGLLCMCIVGGAIVPLIAGRVADITSLSFALIVPILCYSAIAGFGWSVRRPIRNH